MKLSSLICLLTLAVLLPDSAMAQRAYWQQRADYTIDIDMDVKTHRFTGTERIVYGNNSDDDLHQAFFHLYFNAFQPGSMMDLRNQVLPDSDERVSGRIQQLNADEEGHLHVTEVKVNGTPVRIEESGTILEVMLAEPIRAGQEAIFELTYEGQVPIQIRRSGRDNAEGISYSMSQWYPKLCAYDYRGWHPNPYIGREFYGTWGDFRVNINIDKQYVVAGSGILTNANSIGHGYDDQARVRPKKGKLKWSFLAENVHDFVWAADADYKHVTYQGDEGPLCRYFYQEGEDTEAWELLPEIMDAAFGFINERYGAYPYPTYAFIQGGDGGMEYPMATLITGHRSLGGLVGVSVHELMHSWYQMMMATDEARFAWMDEGFTSYASAEVMEHLKNKFNFGTRNDSKELHANTIRGYCRFTESGVEEPLSIHSDHYKTNAAYGVGAYVKGAVYLAQIRYMIGEDDFDGLLKAYYDQWRFKHPEPHDFLRVVEKRSGLELDWFNQYFINTTEIVDYAVDSFIAKDNKVILRRLGHFPMPVDLFVQYEDGTEDYITIPLRMMRGAKEKDGARTFRVEEDWPWTHPTYELKLPEGKVPRRIIIDDSDRLMDVNLDNNRLIIG